MIMIIRGGGHHDHDSDTESINKNEENYHSPVGPRVPTMTLQNCEKDNSNVRQALEENSKQMDMSKDDQEDMLFRAWNNEYQTFRGPQRQLTIILNGFQVTKQANQSRNQQPNPTIYP